MDPLDPLTEIINSGQAFSPLIALEKIVWLMIGVFFLGAVSKSLLNNIQKQESFGKKSFLKNLRPDNHKNEES